MKVKISWAILSIGFMAIVLLPCTAQKPVEHKVTGEEVYKQNCASCHSDGGNNVNQKRPLAGSKELKSLVTFKNYLSAPPGHMPYYRHVVDDLPTLKALYKYCKTLKRPLGKEA